MNLGKRRILYSHALFATRYAFKKELILKMDMQLLYFLHYLARHLACKVIRKFYRYSNTHVLVLVTPSERLVATIVGGILSRVARREQ